MDKAIVIQEETIKKLVHAADELERGAVALQKFIGSGKAGDMEDRGTITKARMRMIRAKERIRDALKPANRVLPDYNMPDDDTSDMTGENKE